MYVSKKLLVGIPAYNCEKQISRVIGGISLYLNDVVDEIIVVDNRSSDRTYETALQYKNTFQIGKLKVKRNIFNVGLGGSHKIIFNYALKENYELVAIVHGDDQASFSELADLLECYKKTGADAVLGSRFMKNSRRIDYSTLRVFGNSVLNVIYSVILMKRIRDLGSGLNLFTLDLIRKTQYMNYSDGFTFNMDLLIKFVTLNANIEFIPITWKEFDQVSNARNFSVGWTALKTVILHALGQTRHTASTETTRYAWE
jgi:glycosyltransferase involved in cell wall biosynthesis